MTESASLEENAIFAEASFAVDKEQLRLDSIQSTKENTDPSLQTMNEDDACSQVLHKEIKSGHESDCSLSDLVQEGSNSTAVGKIRTLKDYMEGKPKKSSRGVDLELIKASPREEDL